MYNGLTLIHVFYNFWKVDARPKHAVKHEGSRIRLRELSRRTKLLGIETILSAIPFEDIKCGAECLIVININERWSVC